MGGVSGPRTFDLTLGSVRSVKGQIVRESQDANLVTNWQAGEENLALADLTNQRSATKCAGLSPQTFGAAAKRPMGQLARLKRDRCDAARQ
jgi:hypothetical protein